MAESAGYGIFRSDLQARMLGLLLLDPNRDWTTSSLRTHLAASEVAVHRELHRALAAGFVVRHQIGRTFVYGAATESPLFQPLRALLERTVGIETSLRSALAEIPGIETAFIHGSYATGTAGPRSDIDLLVLGDVDTRRLRKRVREVERAAGREIDVLAYTPKEFAHLLRAGNSFARSALAGPLRIVRGTGADLPSAV